MVASYHHRDISTTLPFFFTTHIFCTALTLVEAKTMFPFCNILLQLAFLWNGSSLAFQLCSIQRKKCRQWLKLSYDFSRDTALQFSLICQSCVSYSSCFNIIQLFVSVVFLVLSKELFDTCAFAISFVLQFVAVLCPTGRRAVDNKPETTVCQLHRLIHSGYSQLITGE